MQVKTSHWKQLLFPKTLTIDTAITFEKRNFPNFWAVDTAIVKKEEIASFKVDQGFLLAKIIIETTGGKQYVIDGVWNGQAKAVLEELKKV
jgi:hypothetical protein